MIRNIEKDLDDDLENNGNENEETNYYSLGGDNKISNSNLKV